MDIPRHPSADEMHVGPFRSSKHSARLLATESILIFSITNYWRSSSTRCSEKSGIGSAMKILVLRIEEGMETGESPVLNDIRGLMRDDEGHVAVV